MQYKQITAEDAAFLTEIFSIPEYDLYFAENETTKAEWRDRIEEHFLSSQSYIIHDEEKKIGWIMYKIDDRTCMIDIIALHPNERFKGYGKDIISDILKCNPQINEIKLDVQKRNKPAIAFYNKIGFVVEGEEMQPVGNGEESYYKLVLHL